jgi:hypothetical protein
VPKPYGLGTMPSLSFRKGHIMKASIMQLQKDLSRAIALYAINTDHSIRDIVTPNILNSSRNKWPALFTHIDANKFSQIVYQRLIEYINAYMYNDVTQLGSSEIMGIDLCIAHCMDNKFYDKMFELAIAQDELTKDIIKEDKIAEDTSFEDHIRAYITKNNIAIHDISTACAMRFKFMYGDDYNSELGLMGLIDLYFRIFTQIVNPPRLGGYLSLIMYEDSNKAHKTRLDPRQLNKIIQGVVAEKESFENRTSGYISAYD